MEKMVGRRWMVGMVVMVDCVEVAGGEMQLRQPWWWYGGELERERERESERDGGESDEVSIPVEGGDASGVFNFLDFIPPKK